MDEGEENSKRGRAREGGREGGERERIVSEIERSTSIRYINKFAHYIYLQIVNFHALSLYASVSSEIHIRSEQTLN